MSAAGYYLGAIAATIKRDAAIFASYRFRFASQILAMLFTLTMFFYIAKLVRPDALGPHGDYYAFAVVGIVIMAVLTSALTTADVVRGELMQGNFERMVISPLGPVGGVVALAAFPIVYSILFAGVMLTLAVGLFGIPLHPAGIPAALLVAGLGAVAFACLGLLFVAGLLAFKSAMGVTWVVAALSLLGGAYFPVRLFPGWLRWTSEVQPLTPAVDLLRHLLVGAKAIQPVWLELLKLGGFTAVLIPVSTAVLWFAVGWSRRRGTIIEF
jgi:ABC-2 type transport system permease protein